MRGGKETHGDRTKEMTGRKRRNVEDKEEKEEKKGEGETEEENVRMG